MELKFCCGSGILTLDCCRQGENPHLPKKAADYSYDSGNHDFFAAFLFFIASGFVSGERKMVNRRLITPCPKKKRSNMMKKLRRAAGVLASCVV